MSDFLRERLEREIMIFDGAMGTELYRRNFFVNVCFENLSLTAPKVISEIHRSYADAGADVLSTNSFNANRCKLAAFGLAEQTREINLKSAQLARAVAGDKLLVAGSIGPVGEGRNGGELSFDEACAMLVEQSSALIEGGVDFILFESLNNVRATELAVAAAQKFEVPYILSFALNAAGESCGLGTPWAKLYQAADAAGHRFSAIGINCGEGPESTLSALEKVHGSIACPLIVQPNAGLPKKVDNRMMYMSSPEYFTTYALRYINLGARAIGGCCGIGPEYIADMARAVRPIARGAARKKQVVEIVSTTPSMQEIPLESRSNLGAKLARGEWITSVEITPPRGFDLNKTIEKAIRCKAAGIDVINLPDGPRASSRLSPLITAIEIQEKAGIEPMLHLCGRDKSLLGIQADLLGCGCKKINNILFITGDPPKLGDYPFSSGVFDVDSVGLVRLQKKLNQGLDLGGKDLGEQTRVVIGVGADPNAIDPEHEIAHLRDKVEAGADVIITQPVFAPETLLAFLERIRDLNIPVIAGIWPLASYRNAEFMRNEVPGVVVPDSIMARMAAAETREEQRAAGIAIARETLFAVRGAVQGVQLSAPLGNVETALAVLEEN